jgi:hypothetical protein
MQRTMSDAQIEAWLATPHGRVCVVSPERKSVRELRW